MEAEPDKDERLVQEVLIDPQWKEFGASKRKDSLFIKMPLSKARFVRIVLQRTAAKFSKELTEEQQALAAFLGWFHEETERVIVANQASLLYQVPLKQAEKDIRLLQIAADADLLGVIGEFVSCLQKGLANEPEVDWIARVGGPKARRS